MSTSKPAVTFPTLRPHRRRIGGPDPTPAAPRGGSRANRHLGLALCALGVLALALAAPARLAAQDAAPAPSAEAILDGFVQATGGEDAYRKIDNRVTHATVEIPGQGITLPVTLYQARPGKMYSVSESDVLGRIERGIDGEVVWELSTLAGPQIKEGDERALTLRGSHLDAAVEWRTIYPTAEYAGLATVGERPCHKIVLTADDGPAETRFFDAETHLLVKTELTLELPVGSLPMEIFPGDYREVDGVLLAHEVRTTVVGQERVLTIQSIEHNVELPPDRFELPPAVQELVQPPAQG